MIKEIKETAVYFLELAEHIVAAQEEQCRFVR